MTLRKRIGLAGIVTLTAAIGFAFAGQIVPRGASPLPFLLASVRKATYSSPDHARAVTVWVNDAGAAHSGAHWVWFVVERGRSGAR